MAADLGLKKGMELTAVQEQQTPTYEEAIAAIQAAGRPVAMTFKKDPTSKEEADHKRAEVTANTLLAKPLEETEGEMTPLRTVFEEERKTSMGQWLRKHGMQSYAKAFMDAGCVCRMF